MVTQITADQLASVTTQKLVQDLEIKSNASNPTYQVDINSGLVGADDGSVIMEVSSPITVDITASGANGLDTGSEASSTWYYLYLIYNPTTDTVAGLFSVSSTSPTMPSGYTKKRLVSARYNDASSNFIAFVQYNGEVFNNSYFGVLVGGTAGSYTSIDVSNYLPPIASVGSYMMWTSWVTGGGATSYIGFDGTNTQALGYSNYGQSTRGATMVKMPSTESGGSRYIYYWINSTDGQVSVYIRGFTLYF